MITKLVYTYIFWFNLYTPEDYISNTRGLGSIVYDCTYNYNKLCGLGT